MPAPLAPGDDSIARVRPRTVQGRVVLDWSVCLHDGKVVRRRTQAGTVGEARRKARRAAQDLLSASEGWSLASDLGQYLNDVVAPRLAGSSRHAPASKERYAAAIRNLVGDCDRPEHRHRHSLAGLAIRDARFSRLEACLAEVAEEHGHGNEHHARTVLSAHTLDVLVREGIIPSNPIRGARLDLPARPPQTRGGKALTLEEWTRVLEYLLALDVDADGSPVAGRWRREDRIAIRRNTIDVTLLQMSTGLRQQEALALRWSDLETPAPGRLRIPLDLGQTKTGRGRWVEVLDERVVARLLARRDAGLGPYVVGSPADPGRRWDRSNCAKRVAALYREAGTELGIPALGTERTHLWRATLNTILKDAVAEDDRAAWFGHSRAINRRSYNDRSDTSRVLAKAREALGDPQRRTTRRDQDTP